MSFQRIAVLVLLAPCTASCGIYFLTTMTQSGRNGPTEVQLELKDPISLILKPAGYGRAMTPTKIRWSSMTKVRYKRESIRQGYLLMPLPSEVSHFVSIYYVDESGGDRWVSLRVSGRHVRGLLSAVKDRGPIEIEFEDEGSRQWFEGHN